MKTKFLFIISLICLFFTSMNAGAQGTGITQHDWSGTIDNKTYNQGGTHQIILDENITINGTITVDNATTLRILNTSGKTLTIKNGIDGERSTPMFRVIGGSKLAFNYDDKVSEEANDPNCDGTRYARIILDGGAQFSEMDRVSDKDGVWRLTAQSNKRFMTSAIQSIGAVEIYNTTIRNFYFPESAGTSHGVIGLSTPEIQEFFGQVTSFVYRYTTLKNCLVEKCKSSTGTVIMIGNGDNLLKRPFEDPNVKDRLVTLNDVTIKDCVTFSDSEGWGGLIRCRGGSPHSMKLINSTFEGNFSHADGAVLWWNACGHPETKCTIDGCRFINNRAMREAGAMRMEGNFEFLGGKTIVSGNECLGLLRDKSVTPNTYLPNSAYLGSGGGMQIFGYAGGQGVGTPVLEYHLPTCLEVKDNYAAGYGGGIAFDFTTQSTLPEGTTINAYFEGMSIYDNSAAMGGGGVFFSDKTDVAKNYTFNIFLNSGSIEDNIAPNGGGIYVNKINVGGQEGKTINVSRNLATSGCGGGIYLQNGNITINSVNITENTASKVNDSGIYGGGGLFVKNGSFTINSGSISNNETDLYGGGVLVSNEDATRQVVNLTNGNIKSNRGKYGGGIAALGALNLGITNITIEDNRAMNGGGVFAKGSTSGYGVNLTYNSGIIRYNRARSYETSPLTTVFNKSYNQYSGIGGGIYLGQYTHLKIGSPSNFGIYSNVADNGADDIFGYNKNVYIELPNVKNLNLGGYTGGKTQKLFWAEDYITNDIYYNKGTYLKGSAWLQDKTNQRYRDAMDNGPDGQKYLIDFGNSSTRYFEIDGNGNSTYLALTIGWNQSTLTIVKKGMKEGDTAIFKIYNGSNEYMTVVLSDKDLQSDGTRSKKINLSADGVWKVVETAWSWAYTPEYTELTKVLSVNSTEEERIFEFVNTPKSDTPQYGESIKINRMK